MDEEGAVSTIGQMPEAPKKCLEQKKWKLERDL